MNSVSTIISVPHRKFSLVPDMFTSISGEIWCLRLFTPWRKVHKRGKLEIFK
jgi:hypothetical protein